MHISGQAPMIDPFVSAAWALDHRNEIVLADVRFYLDGRSPRAAYDAGHLPGAVFIDLERTLAAPASPLEGRHPLPSPEVFAGGMRAAGIGDGTTVVAYDDAGGVIAARLVWMLRALGQDAAVLDGGLDGWSEPLQAAEPEVVPAEFTTRPWPAERLASIDDAQDPRNMVIDARPRERYDGAPDAVDPRCGHIPGAQSLPCREHLKGGVLRPRRELRAAVDAVGAGGVNPVVSYCGSGVTACHNLLILEHVGLPPGRLYPGSWSQYSHTDLPVETSS